MSGSNVGHLKWPEEGFGLPDEPTRVVFRDGIIMYATIDKLVEHATLARYDHENRRAIGPPKEPDIMVLLCNSTFWFIKPKDFVELLFQRYRQPLPQGDALEVSLFVQHFQTPMQRRVLKLLNNWIEANIFLIGHEEELVQKILNFSTQDVNPNYYAFCPSVMNLRSKIESEKAKKMTPPTSIPKPMLPQKATTLFDYHPKEVARQITIHESQLFRKIPLYEFKGALWKKRSENLKEKIPNIMEMKSFMFNIVSWVTESVLFSPNQTVRVTMIIFFLKLAIYLKELNNYNGCKEVMVGLRCSPITRLKPDWENVPRKLMLQLEELEQFVSAHQNSKSLRVFMDTTIPPGIPYLWFFLNDFAYIEVGSDEVDNLLNVPKLQMISKSAVRLKKFQAVPYWLQSVPEIQKMIVELKCNHSNEECYQQSISILPRTTTNHSSNSSINRSSSSSSSSSIKYDLFTTKYFSELFGDALLFHINTSNNNNNSNNTPPNTTTTIDSINETLLSTLTSSDTQSQCRYYDLTTYLVSDFEGVYLAHGSIIEKEKSMSVFFRGVFQFKKENNAFFAKVELTYPSATQNNNNNNNNNINNNANNNNNNGKIVDEKWVGRWLFRKERKINTNPFAVYKQIEEVNENELNRFTFNGELHITCKGKDTKYFGEILNNYISGITSNGSTWECNLYKVNEAALKAELTLPSLVVEENELISQGTSYSLLDFYFIHDLPSHFVLLFNYAKDKISHLEALLTNSVTPTYYFMIYYMSKKAMFPTLVRDNIQYSIPITKVETKLKLSEVLKIEVAETMEYPLLYAVHMQLLPIVKTLLSNYPTFVNNYTDHYSSLSLAHSLQSHELFSYILNISSGKPLSLSLDNDSSNSNNNNNISNSGNSNSYDEYQLLYRDEADVLFNSSSGNINNNINSNNNNSNNDNSSSSSSSSENLLTNSKKLVNISNLITETLKMFTPLISMEGYFMLGLLMEKGCNFDLMINYGADDFLVRLLNKSISEIEGENDKKQLRNINRIYELNCFSKYLSPLMVIILSHNTKLFNHLLTSHAILNEHTTQEEYISIALSILLSLFLCDKTTRTSSSSNEYINSSNDNNDNNNGDEWFFYSMMDLISTHPSFIRWFWTLPFRGTKSMNSNSSSNNSGNNSSNNSGYNSGNINDPNHPHYKIAKLKVLEDVYHPLTFVLQEGNNKLCSYFNTKFPSLFFQTYQFKEFQIQMYPLQYLLLRRLIDHSSNNINSNTPKIRKVENKTITTNTTALHIFKYEEEAKLIDQSLISQNEFYSKIDRETPGIPPILMLSFFKVIENFSYEQRLLNGSFLLMANDFDLELYDISILQVIEPYWDHIIDNIMLFKYSRDYLLKIGFFRKLRDERYLGIIKKPVLTSAIQYSKDLSFVKKLIDQGESLFTPFDSEGFIPFFYLSNDSIFYPLFEIYDRYWDINLQNYDAFIDHLNHPLKYDYYNDDNDDNNENNENNIVGGNNENGSDNNNNDNDNESGGFVSKDREKYEEGGEKTMMMIMKKKKISPSSKNNNRRASFAIGARENNPGSPPHHQQQQQQQQQQQPDYNTYGSSALLKGLLSEKLKSEKFKEKETIGVFLYESIFSRFSTIFSFALSRQNYTFLNYIITKYPERISAMMIVGVRSYPQSRIYRFSEEYFPNLPLFMLDSPTSSGENNTTQVIFKQSIIDLLICSADSIPKYNKCMELVEILLRHTTNRKVIKVGIKNGEYQSTHIISRLFSIEYFKLQLTKLSSTHLSSVIVTLLAQMSSRSLQSLQDHLQAHQMLPQFIEYCTTSMSQYLMLTFEEIPRNYSTPEKLFYYLIDLLQGRQSVKKLRVVIVGMAAAGKTTIVKGLIGDRWNGTELKHFEERNEGWAGQNEVQKKKRYGVTDGIDVHQWVPSGTDVEVSLWDFAGQEVYYITHQFFLAEGSLFLIVFNVKKSIRQAKLLFWLNSIQSKVEKQHVLLIGTHVDQIKPKERSARLRELSDEISEIYEKWRFNFSSEKLIQLIRNKEEELLFWPTGQNDVIEKLSKIQSVIIDAAASREAVPSSYIKLLQSINKERRSRHPPVMDLHSVILLGREVQIQDQQQVLRAMSLLHEWGELLYFQDQTSAISTFSVGNLNNDIARKIQICIDPKWLVEVFKSVASFRHADSSSKLFYNPIVTKLELQERWRSSNLPTSIYPYLYELLEHRYQIIAKIPQNEKEKEVEPLNCKYIIPSLLTSSPTKSIWQPLHKPLKNSILISNTDIEYFREYHLQFTPHGLFSRLLVLFFQVEVGSTFKIIEYSQNDIIIHSNEEKTSAIIKLIDDGKSTFGKIISLTVRGEQNLWKTVMVRAHYLIIDMLTNWYPGLRSRLAMKVGLNCKASGTHEIDYEQCVSLFLSNTKIEGINLSDLLPELSVPILSWKSGKFQIRDIERSEEQYKRDVQLLLELGNGMFGQVYKAKFQNQLVAVKVVSNVMVNHDDMMDFCKEIGMLYTLDHPNIVKLVYFYPKPLAFVMELITGGDLQKALLFPGKFSWEVYVKIAYDIACGLTYMHTHNPPILHCDLKAANILVIDVEAAHPQIAVKVADIGCARFSDNVGKSGNYGVITDVKGYRNIICEVWNAAMTNNPNVPQPIHNFHHYIIDLVEVPNTVVDLRTFHSITRKLERLLDGMNSFSLQTSPSEVEASSFDPFLSLTSLSKYYLEVEKLMAIMEKFEGKALNVPSLHRLLYFTIKRDDFELFRTILFRTHFDVNQTLTLPSLSSKLFPSSSSSSTNKLQNQNQPSTSTSPINNNNNNNDDHHHHHQLKLIHVVSYFGRKLFAEHIVENCNALIIFPNKHLIPPLYLCIQHHHSHMLPIFSDSFGYLYDDHSPLTYAIQHRCMQSLLYLLQSSFSANTGLTTDSLLLRQANHPSSTPLSPLQYALNITTKEKDIFCKILLEFGAQYPSSSPTLPSSPSLSSSSSSSKEKKGEEEMSLENRKFLNQLITQMIVEYTHSRLIHHSFTHLQEYLITCPFDDVKLIASSLNSVMSSKFTKSKLIRILSSRSSVISPSCVELKSSSLSMNVVFHNLHNYRVSVSLIIPFNNRAMVEFSSTSFKIAARLSKTISLNVVLYSSSSRSFTTPVFVEMVGKKTNFEYYLFPIFVNAVTL